MTNTKRLFRTKTGFLNFVGARRFDGGFEVSPEIGVDDKRFAYGANRPYPGPDIFSTKLRLGWTEKEFFLRAEVRDEIHFHPNYGHFLYNGDCLQLALTQKGPEFFRFLSPTEIRSPGFQPLENNVSLGEKYLTVEKTRGGLKYELRLPWREMAPVVPKPDSKLGVYFIAINNNGTGHLDTLHCPVPIDGMWMKPDKWGILLLES